MTYYKKNIKDLNVYLKEIVKHSCKPLFISILILIPLIIYFLLVGYLADDEALRYGYGLLAIIIMIMIYIIRVIFACKKNMKLYFKKANSNGEIEYGIYLDNNEFVIENFTNKTINRICKSEIIKIKSTKRIIFIKLVDKSSVFFPKTDELVEFFNKNLIVNSKKINK